MDAEKKKAKNNLKVSDITQNGEVGTIRLHLFLKANN